MRNSIMNGRAALGAALVLGALWATPAQAHRRDFPFTYDWQQPHKGERELEVQSFYSRGEVVQQFEVEYGLSERLVIAPYAVFEKERGGGYRYHEFKLEGRYQLSGFRTGKVLSSLYLEYARERGGSGELEGKLILSRYGRNGSDLSLNLIAERALTDGAKFEKGYSLGYAVPLEKGAAGRFLRRYEARGGFELIHNLSERQINAGPTLAFSPGGDLWLTAGYALALNKRRAHGDQVRLNLEYEF